MRRLRLAAIAASAALMLAAAAVHAQGTTVADAFDRDRFKDGFEHDIAFRVAAIEVAWGAEHLCDETTAIESFVLWSTGTLRRALNARQAALFKAATGMDQRWRIAWLDEAAPDELKVGQVVTAINGRPLPGSGTVFELSALWRGSLPVSQDDAGFWQVLSQARDEAHKGTPMMLTLEGGRSIAVPTQTGCAGIPLGSAFDHESDTFLRLDAKRTKVPGNALLAAATRDERRWLAAFATYFMASAGAIEKQRNADNMSTAFTVGKVLTAVVPGAGTLLSAVEASAQRAMVVDSQVGQADLFANEVVFGLGGEPDAALRLSERLASAKARADVLPFSAFRLSNMQEHVQQLRKIDAAREAAEKAAEKPSEKPAGPPADQPAAKPAGASPPAPRQ